MSADAQEIAAEQAEQAEQAELRRVARAVCARTGPGCELDWSQVVELGWCGLDTPLVLGGSGASFAAVAAVTIERGRAAVAGPFTGPAVLGGALLAMLEPGGPTDVLSRSAATGERRVVPALSTREAPGNTQWLFAGEHTADEVIVTGEVDFVLDAVDAEVLLVPVRADDEVAVAVVAPDTDGITVTPQPVLDATRQLATVTAQDLHVPNASLWRFVELADDAVAKVLERAALAIGCDSLGAAEAMLEATVAYVGERHQFGRPIGSFQAVKHACANAAVQVRVAQSLTDEAVAAIVQRTPGPEASRAVARAVAYTKSAAVDVVGAALQLHGGIGYTWDANIHLFLKRTALNRSLFGSVTDHRHTLTRRWT